MRLYRKIVNFRYKNKPYTMFIDEKDKYYFLGINVEGDFEYLDINTFLELCRLFSNPPYVPLSISSDKSKKKMKIVPKILIGGVVTTLTLGSLFVIPAAINEFSSQKEYNQYIQQYYAQNEQYTQESQTNKITFDIEDSDEDFVLDTFINSEQLDTIYVYDMDYLNLILDYESVTLEDFNEIIDKNDKIIDKFKPFVKKYCEALINKQPEAERRVLYENLKSLEIKEVNKMDLVFATMSRDAAACYVRDENRIYVLDEYEYIEGTWNFQILYHELSHVARTGMWDSGKSRRRVQCEGLNFYTLTSSEALNSLFAVGLFDYEEKDIAYQLQSNYFKVMVESMDNYSITDYMNHSLGYFVQKLDEFHGDKNYATCIMELIETQYNDYHSDRIEIAQSEFYPLYEYISDVYYKNKLNNSMSYEEAKVYVNKLVEDIMFDVPAEYNIDVNYFYQYFDDYCNSLGIMNSKVLK